MYMYICVCKAAHHLQRYYILCVCVCMYVCIGSEKTCHVDNYFKIILFMIIIEHLLIYRMHLLYFILTFRSEVTFVLKISYAEEKLRKSRFKLELLL